MDKKTTDIVAYLTWVGLVIAFVIGDREKCKFHINQSLVIWLVGTVVGAILFPFSKLFLIGWIFAIVGTLVDLFCLACCVIGLVAALQGEEKKVPFLGEFVLYK